MMRPLDFVCDVKGQQVAAALQQAAATGFAPLEVQMQTAKGPVPDEFNAVPVKDENGALLGIAGAGRDISERKQTEKSLRLNLAAMEAADSAIAITDTRGVLEWINPAFTKLTGYSAAEISGQNPRLLKSGKHSPEFYEQMWKQHHCRPFATYRPKPRS